MKRDRRTVELRHAEMLALIRRRQEIMVEELSEIFGVSTMTVRRDLQTLEERGKISRFHGGASVDVRAVPEGARANVTECRLMIARAAARLVQNGDTILINGSMTALGLLEHLESTGVRVFTNNGLAVGQRYPAGVEVTLSGGVLRGSNHILTGDAALRSLMAVRGRMAFLGCTGISSEGEILCGIPSELGINETMIEHADAYCILADHTKIGKSGTYASFHLERPGCVITDAGAAPEVVERLRAIGMQVLIASEADVADPDADDRTQS